MKKILIISSANMDFVMDTARVPVAGETIIEKGSYKYVPGGKGANSAIAVARLGGKSVFCTTLGIDANGNALYELYNKEGIDTSHIVFDGVHPTGLAAIMVEPNGSNRIIVYPGANLCIYPTQINTALDSAPDALFMQLETSTETIVHAANESAKRGVPVFIDAGPANKEFPLEDLPYLEVFSPNESETEIFTGIRPTDDESCRLAALELSKRVKAHYYVIKLGGRGCYITDLTEARTVPTFDGPVVDTTAAGDSFTAALTLEYLRSGDIFAAARFANAVGTIVVGKAGAAPSIPYAKDVDEFLARVSE